MVELSVASGATAGLIMLLAVPLNSVMIYCLIKEHKKKYSSLFYKLLLNIAIADLLTGLIPSPAALNTLVKEAQGLRFTKLESYITQTSLFLTDSVALIILTILSIERYVALVYPIKHHKGLKKRTENILVVSVWPLGMLLVLPYFYFSYIRQLLVYSSVVVGITIISLVVTTITYRQKLGTTVVAIKIKKNKVHNLHYESPKHSANTVNKDQQSSIEEVAKPNTANDKETTSSVQHKVTRTFIIMLCVFLISYVPTTLTIMYMNACMECNCAAVHVMRDYSFMFILSSSVLRPLNFILTLKHLRTSVVRIFKKDEPDSYEV